MAKRKATKPKWTECDTWEVVADEVAVGISLRSYYRPLPPGTKMVIVTAACFDRIRASFAPPRKTTKAKGAARGK